MRTLLVKKFNRNSVVGVKPFANSVGVFGKIVANMFSEYDLYVGFHDIMAEYVYVSETVPTLSPIVTRRVFFALLNAEAVVRNVFNFAPVAKIKSESVETPSIADQPKVASVIRFTYSTLQVAFTVEYSCAVTVTTAVSPNACRQTNVALNASFDSGVKVR